MTDDINLLESAQGKKKSEGKFGEGSLIIPVIVLILVFLVLGGAKFYSSYLTKQGNSINEKIALESKNLVGKNVDRVINFDQRVKLASAEIPSRENYNDLLGELETLTVSGILANSLKYSSSSLEINLTADSFKTVARQILSFKQSKYFKDLKVGNISRNSDGKIVFVLSK